MTTIDLDTLSLKDLKTLRIQVDRAIASFDERKKQEAIAVLEERAREFGFTLAELLGASTVRRRAPAVAKYASPSDPSITWSGRGRQPRWFQEALSNGSTPESLLIPR